MRFCEQRGEDDPADAGKRAQYCHVTLPLLSRHVVGGLGQPSGDTVDLATGTGELCGNDLEIGDGGFVGSGGERAHDN